MSSRQTVEPSPIERLRDTPRILKALHQAAEQAMERHRQAGVPVATWRNGAVEWISPEDIPVGDVVTAGRRESGERRR